MGLSRELKRVATSMHDRTPAVPLRMRIGTIASVTAGAAADGNSAVSVTIGGDVVASPYVSGYAPIVGHRVYVLINKGSPLIAGRVIGFPVV